MAERERVIVELEQCLCDSVVAVVPADTVRDVLALLKAQEAMEPVVDIDTWKCGNCGHTLEHQQLLGDNVLFHEQYNYCPNCGKEVKWE